MLNPRTGNPGFAEVFGKNLARQRQAKGVSQEELGFVAGLHRTAVGQLERGERVARSDTLLRLCCSLDIDPSLLFEGMSWKPAIFSKGELITEVMERGTRNGHAAAQDSSGEADGEMGTGSR